MRSTHRRFFCCNVSIGGAVCIKTKGGATAYVFIVAATCRRRTSDVFWTVMSQVVYQDWQGIECST